MTNQYARVQILTYLFLFTFFSSTASADIVLDSGAISVPSIDTTMPQSGGIASFSLTAAEIPDVELIADLFIVDAGVDVVVNGTSLFTQFDDISQFGPTDVFVGTGVPNGGIEYPFRVNDDNLPRLTIESDSAGTTFSGAVEEASTSTITYTPNPDPNVFAIQDFNSLLNVGSNTIEFFVLNGFDDAALDGEFEVKLNTTVAVPEPGSASLLGLFLVGYLSTRRRSK